jgi:uncharacterized protein
VGNDVSAVEVANREFADRELRWLQERRDLGLHFMRMPTVTKQVTCAAVSAATQIIGAAGTVYSRTDHPLVPRDGRPVAQTSPACRRISSASVTSRAWRSPSC